MPYQYSVTQLQCWNSVDELFELVNILQLQICLCFRSDDFDSELYWSFVELPELKKEQIKLLRTVDNCADKVLLDNFLPIQLFKMY